MREYGKIIPRYWQAGSGAQLRGDFLSRLVGAYVFTAPTSNPIGLYCLPVEYVATDLGCSPAAALKSLKRCEEVGICAYDRAESLMFVREMARVGPANHPARMEPPLPQPAAAP